MLILKRDKETLEKFDVNKIIRAIEKAMLDVDLLDKNLAEQIGATVEDIYTKGVEEEHIFIEEIQDTVELLLMERSPKVAKAYILYREERNKVRDSFKSPHDFLTTDFLRPYTKKEDPFPTELGKFVYYRTYSRPVPEENRRENWWETVARVVNFSADLERMALQKVGKYNKAEFNRLKETAEDMFRAMYNLELFPSGRSLWVKSCPL